VVAARKDGRRRNGRRSPKRCSWQRPPG